MKVSFWLLDINPRIDDECDTCELWLWGLDAKGNRVLVIDKNITAYFYAVVKEGCDPSETSAEIMNSYPSSIVKAEAVNRRYFGKPVQAIKVYCRVATETGKVAKQLREFEGVKDCLEDDIRGAMRYLIDNNLAPCEWLEVEAAEEENKSGIRVDKVYSAKSIPKQLDCADKPNLKTLSFSMISYSREGSPKPDRNPVVIISTVASTGEEKQFAAGEDRNDKLIIQQFVDYVCQFDPDVIVSFGANA